MEKRYILISGIVFVFFCLLLFYVRIGIQRFIIIRVQSAREVSRTANDHLRIMKDILMKRLESKGAFNQ